MSACCGAEIGGSAPARAAVGSATVALIGNPNTGKSTLFNRLTGARQRVGNYPGVTVAKRIGETTIAGRDVTVIDLPGAYSLAAVSPDERIAADVLSGRRGERPAVAVCLVDATHLDRGLHLACQAADLGVPVVVAMNFMDEAAAKGIEIDDRLIASRLGTSVVPISARSGAGIPELRTAIARAIESPAQMRLPAWSAGVERATHALREEIAAACAFELGDAELRRVLFDSNSAYLDLAGYPREHRIAMLDRARGPIRAEGVHPLAAESLALHRFIASALDGAVRHGRPTRRNLTGVIDAALTHRGLGLVVFAGLMLLVFESIYTLATPAMDAIEAAFGSLGGVLGEWLAPLPVFRSLVCDGVVAGVGGVVVFLPQIFLLFFFIALLEDTGYMARAAFLMDRLFGWCGLNGKSFVPLLSSYACAVPGVMATRTIEDPKARLATILVAPLMSCSARLPVYLLMIGAFIEPMHGATVAALALFGIQLLGLAVAMPAAWVLNRWVLRIPAQPFVLELPPYRMPVARDVLWRMWMGGKEFLQRAGTIIVIISILVWALLYFPREPQSGAASGGTEPAQIENSYLGRAGRFLEPVFAPAGFDWRITIGVLASFPAREVIVSTLGIIYHLDSDAAEDDDSLAAALRGAKWSSGPRAGQPVYTVATALAIMVFFAFCMQCASTLAVIAREAGARYAVVTFVYMTALAWLAAIVTYQVASRILP